MTGALSGLLAIALFVGVVVFIACNIREWLE